MSSVVITISVGVASLIGGAVLGEILTPMLRVRKRIAKAGEKLVDVGEKIAEVDDGDEK